MSGPVRVVGFLLALVVVFAGAAVAGMAIGPVADPVDAHQPGHDSTAADRRPGSRAAPPQTAAALPGGLMVSQNGFAFRLTRPREAAGRDVPVTFTIEGPDGRPVTAYDVEHGKRLHLIAVRRDLTGYQHVHPRLDDDGTWAAALDLTPGQWRLFADFTPAGAAPLTLGTDLAVPGDYAPAPPTGPSRTATVDGYTVSLDGRLTPGSDSRLTFSVSKDGEPVTDLQPYLGAYGHLVALREGDLAYLHVHPEGTPADGTTEPGPDVVFYAAVPSTGTYRLFLDFRHQGVVRTAAFSLTTTADVAESATGGAHGGH
jgi:hypothetical protein